MIIDLINRIKNAVKEQDQSQYGKLQKLICLEEGQSNGHLSETCSVDVEAQQEANLQLFDENLFLIF